MKRNEILGEHKKGTKAVKYNKKPKDHAAEFGKAKEKLAPVKPMEGYNPNSASAEHRRKLDQSHAADLKARADAPDATERDKQRYQNYLDKKEQMANDYNDRMERESVEEMRDRRDSYQRDYDSSVSGMGNDFKRDFKRRELEHELGHETNNYAVAIDGRTWKVFASKNHAQAVARSLQNKGKKATVHETGAEPTAEAMGAEVGKITKVDPATKKATLTKPDGSSMEVDSTALKPTPDGKMSMDTPDANELKAGTSVVSTEDMTAPTTDSTSPINGDEENVDLRRLRELAGQPVAPTTDDGEYDAIDSAESYKAWLQKSAAADGLTPEQSAELVNMTVTDEDGSIDMDATMVKTMKGLADLMPQLLAMFTEWVAVLEKAKVDPAQWSSYTPEEQKSIDEAIAEGKARLPELEAAVKNMQAQMPELDKAMADRKAAGTTMKIPAKAPVEEGELSEAGEGMSDEYLQKVASGAPGRHMITPEKAKEELARRAAGGKQAVSEPKDDAGDSAPHVPKDYQTREPLKKGPDGKWYNSKGEERDSLHGGPVNNGAAMFRSMTPRTPTQESADNELLQKMLSIAGLK